MYQKSGGAGEETGVFGKTETSDV